MVATGEIDVLLIRSWTLDLGPVVASFAAAGLGATFTRVDIEPALNAALTRRAYDVAVYDPRGIGLSRAIVEQTLRAHHSTTPLLEIEDVATIGDAVARTLHARRS